MHGVSSRLDIAPLRASRSFGSVQEPNEMAPTTEGQWNSMQQIPVLAHTHTRVRGESRCHAATGGGCLQGSAVCYVEIVAAAAHAAAAVAAMPITVAQLKSAPLSHRIVVAAVIVGVEELLEPLEELEVVLETALNQFVNWNDLSRLGCGGREHDL